MKNKNLILILMIVIVLITIVNFKRRDNMTRIKISELNEKTQLYDNDLIPIVDTINNETKKVSKKNLLKDGYSTTEVKTNKIWKDGKPIYRTVVNIGDTTDSTRWQDGTMVIYTDISPVLETVTSIQVIGKKIFDGNIIAYTDITNWVFTESGTIGIVNWSVYNTGVVMLMALSTTNLWPGGENVTDGYAIIEYTKSTD